MSMRCLEMFGIIRPPDRDPLTVKMKATDFMG
jgi:hypothetical protein